MKYIRTKDKILLFRDYEDIDSVLTNIGWIYKTEIIKEADNIEDLLDEFVCNTKLVNLWELEITDLRGNIIYGAIWTDKGLIYVAELNEKGNWELI